MTTTVILTYLGTPGVPGQAGAASAVSYADTTTPPLGAAFVQDAIVNLQLFAKAIANTAALGLQPTYHHGSQTLANGATTLVVSDVVSTATPGSVSIWQAGRHLVPLQDYQAVGTNTITLTFPIGEPGGALMNWVHNHVDPAQVAAARAALGL